MSGGISAKGARKDRRRDRMLELVAFLRGWGKPILAPEASRLLGWPDVRASSIARMHKNTIKITDIGRERFLSLTPALSSKGNKS